MPQFAKWYHCNMNPMGRSAGRSAVAAAAYRIGESLYDERTQLTHDYTRKSGVEAFFIVAPANAPDWAHDPQKLWNEAERAERKCNSQVAREWELALPASVGTEEREQITRAFAEHLAERYGVVAMVALHEPSRHGDDRNYHAHILTTTRSIDEDGLGDKTRILVTKNTGSKELVYMRKYAAELINATLAEAGSEERVSPDSYKTRGIEQTPTEHLGHKANAKERRGERSERGDLNREIEEANQKLKGLIEEREELDRQIREAQNQAPANAPDITEPSQEPEPTHWQDRINAEGETEGGSGATTPINAEEKNTEPDRGANSSITDPLNIRLAKQITTRGEVQHKGLIKSWVEHALDWAYELGDDLAYAWEVFKGNDPDLPETREPAEPEQERGGFWQRFVGGGKTAEVRELKEQPPSGGDPAEPPAEKKHFWQRFVSGGKPAETPEPSTGEGIHSEEPSGNRFQQLTRGAREAQPSPERPRSGLDYWRNAREEMSDPPEPREREAFNRRMDNMPDDLPKPTFTREEREAFNRRMENMDDGLPKFTFTKAEREAFNKRTENISNDINPDKGIDNDLER